jgi:hypothetical protein
VVLGDRDRDAAPDRSTRFTLEKAVMEAKKRTQVEHGERPC